MKDGRTYDVVMRALDRLERTPDVEIAMTQTAQLLARETHVEQARWLIWLLSEIGPLEAEPNHSRRAAAAVRINGMLRVHNAIRHVTQLLAAQPAEEQAFWIRHVLATLDPCEPGPDLYGESVLKPVRDALEQRIEAGQW